MNVLLDDELLQNIKISYYEHLLKVDIFDGIINLSRKKSDAKIDIIDIKLWRFVH